MRITQDEFTLEKTMIRINLEHLLSAISINWRSLSVENSASQAILSMDDAEKLQLSSVSMVSNRAYQLQTGWL